MPATGTISGTYNPGDQKAAPCLAMCNSSPKIPRALPPHACLLPARSPALRKNISTRLAVGTSDNVLIGASLFKERAEEVNYPGDRPELTKIRVPGPCKIQRWSCTITPAR